MLGGTNQVAAVEPAMMIKSMMNARTRFAWVVMLGWALLGTAGCAARTLNVSQGDRINNAMHHDRHPDQRTGDPLEVTIVCVHPADLEREANRGLKPGSGITCKDWYDHRPVRAGGGEGRFDLPSEQVFLLTNEAQFYGTKLGPALNGALKDGKSEIVIKGIPFQSMKLHSRDSAIYVFPKFIGPDWNVLPVKPAEFSPPGAYASRLTVKIGVDDSREHYGQFIENTSLRRMHAK